MQCPHCGSKNLYHESVSGNLYKCLDCKRISPASEALRAPGPIPEGIIKSFGTFTANQKYLPTRVHCPVCGEIMLFLPLKPDETASASATGALAAKKVSCGCGVEGVLCLRKTPDKLHLYSMTFWILPATAEKKGTLTNEEIRRWLGKMPPPGPVA